MTNFKHLKKPLACAIGLMIAGSAIAEEQKPARKGAAAMMLEEVMVVARKKNAAEAVQDVPLAISAYGADQLDAMFVKNLGDLSYSAPNVQLEAVGTFPGVQNFSIRGQGINSSIPSVDPTVGTFVDGIYLGVTYGVVLDMFDLDSVEILRGPQGLLFGRNVTGGAVNVRTALPGEEFEAKIKINMTDHDQTTVAGSVSFPVSDTLSGKVVAYYDDDEGYFDNEFDGTPTPVGAPNYINPAKVGDDAGALETTFFRTAWVWKASDDLELIFRGETGTTEGDGAAWTRVDNQKNGQWDEYTTQMDEAGDTDIEWDQAIIEANYELSNGTITNIVGWRDLSAYSAADVDGSDLQLFTVAGTTEQDQISNELRYAGNFLDDKLSLTTGLFYFEQDIDYQESRENLVIALGGSMEHTTWGIFTSGDYSMTDALTLTAGIRYTEEEKDAEIIGLNALDGSSGTGAPGGPCRDTASFNCTIVELSDDWSNVTPKLGLSYQLNDDAQVYAFWTKGFRSGGVNFRNAKPNVIDAGPTNEEEQNSYEIGVKSELADGRLRLNAAYFYNTIDEMQRELNVSDPDVVVLQGTVNAGDAIIQGVEFDFVALLTDNFSLNGSVGYIDGSWDKINPAYDPAVLAVSNPAALAAGLFIGDDLPRLSPWTANIGATYDINLDSAGFITLRANYSFRDSAAYTDNNSTYFDQQHEATASINYTSADEHWRASLYGKNLNDEARWGNLTNTSLGVLGPMQKGRVIGLEGEYRF